MINLDRAPKYTDHNIPLTDGNYYRGLTADDYESLWRVDENGSDIMTGNGKGGTDTLSFQKNYPNDLYVNRLVKANMIIEGDARMGVDDSGSTYSYVDQLERKRVESGETPLRVYVRRPLGEEAITLVNDWEKVFDSFPEMT